MVRTCSAPGCKNRFSKGGKVSFHSFPIKNLELCKKWVEATGRIDFSPSKYSQLCSEHFLPSDFITEYLLRPNLKNNAVPSVFQIPEYIKFIKSESAKEKDKSAKPLQETPSLKRTINESLQTPPPHKIILIEVQAKCDNNQSTITSNKSNPKPKDESIRIKEMKRKIKTLQQKLRRKEKKIGSLTDVVKQLTEKKLISQETANVLEANFTGVARDLITSHFKNQNRHSNGKRYTEEIKKFALTLHFYSPNAYNFVRKAFSLPCPSSLAHWTSTVKCDPGFLKDVFTHLQKKVKQISRLKTVL